MVVSEATAGGLRPLFLRGHEAAQALVDVVNEATGELLSRIGVPTTPFPAWLRCAACNELAPIDSGVFGFHARHAATVTAESSSGRR